jgi:uncharacterized protein YjbJ (UPF0337 family)
MGNQLDKADGAIKEVVAEILGDGNLQEEGRRQRKMAEREKKPNPPKSPAENLHDLT